MMGVLATLACLALGYTVDRTAATAPAWEQTIPTSMFSSVGVFGRVDGESPVTRFAAATWLHDPKMVEVLTDSGSRNLTNLAWTYRPAGLAGTPSTLAVATARHIDQSSAGLIDLVVAHRFQPNNTSGSACYLLGFASGGNGTHAWMYEVPGDCTVDLTLEGDSEPALAISDDGSTVAFAVAIGSIPQLHCVDGQTGMPKFVFHVQNQKPSATSVSLSRDGERIAYGNGLKVYVLDTSKGQLLTGPLTRQIVSDVHICPMGIFLLYAVNEGSAIRRWNAAAGEFQLTPHQPETPSGGMPNSWVAVSHSTSVNGGGSNPAGFLAAIGWLGLGSHQGVAKLTVMSMLSGHVFVEWTSSSKGAGYENFPVMAMHRGFTALGLWGNTNPASGAPNVLLFHSDSGNSTVMEYAAKGSVMAIDIVYVPPHELLPTKETAPVGGRRTRDALAAVYLIAAAKLEHANVVGKGGQCVAFRVPVKARPSV